MIPRSALLLRDQILAEAHARAVQLEQDGLTLEQGLPVLRLRLGGVVIRSTCIRLRGRPSYRPDVITVHGSGFRASRMWPRKLDGTFNIVAAVDHLLGLVGEELGRPKPDLQVAAGIAASASGVHVILGAAVLLGTVPADATPDELVGRVDDDQRRQKIEAHAASGGLTDSDLRVLSTAAGMFLGRALRFDADPFEPISDRILTVLRIGALKGGRVERRFVLVLDRQADQITVADPGGDGLSVMPRRKLLAAWKLGTMKGTAWLGTLGRDGVGEAP